MKNLNFRLISIVLGLFCIPILASALPAPGEWAGSIEGDKIAFIVSNNGKSINQITINLTGFYCGGVTSSVNSTTTFVKGLPISANRFTDQSESSSPLSGYGSSYGYSTEKEITTITGEFNTKGKYASGTFVIERSGESCSRSWEARPIIASKGSRHGN